MNRLMVQVHRYLGLFTLLFLVLAGATGSLLAFSGELDGWLNPELRRVADRGPPPPVADTVAKLQRRHPALQVTSAPLEGARGRAIEIKVAPWPGDASLGFDQVFVDPYSAAVIGVRDDRPGWDRAHLMRGVYFLHYTLLAGDWGRWLMGVVAVGWLVGNLVGFYLTLPAARPFWRRWTPVWTVNFRARLPRVLLDLHRASGLWLFVGVFVLSFTSGALNFYSEAFRPAVAALSPPKPTPWDRPAPPIDSARRPRLSFAQAQRFAVVAAVRDRLGLRPAVETYDAERRLYGVRFTSNGREQYAGLGPVTYYVDDDTGRPAAVDNPLTDSAGQKVLRAIYPLHSGQVAGFATRLLVCLLGLSVVEMSITGLIVWWKKRKLRVAARRARRRTAAGGAAGC